MTCDYSTKRFSLIKTAALAEAFGLPFDNIGLNGLCYGGAATGTDVLLKGNIQLDSYANVIQRPVFSLKSRVFFLISKCFYFI